MMSLLRVTQIIAGCLQPILELINRYTLKMPQRSKKDHKHSHHSDSRWHNFHFSGKLILCSVIFGFLLILIGGILLAIGMDRDEDTKSDNYDDLQKKPPLMFVGPVIMGIGGFTVIVGILMCLVETKVFRSRNADSNPLINGEGESTRRESEAGGIESNPTAVPSSSHHERNRDGHHKKPSKRTKNNKKSQKSKSQKEASSSGSEPIPINSPKNFLSASDKFLTPQNSFSQENMPMQNNSRDANIQTSASLMKSFTSSGETWNASTEFQTPSTSLNDNSPTFQHSEKSIETPSPQSVMSIPITPIGSVIQNERHEFLTPKNSNAEILEETPRRVEALKQKNVVQDNKHEFLTPKNSSAELLDEPNHLTENGLKQTIPVSKDQKIPVEISATKPTAISVVADVHTPPKQGSSKVIEASNPPKIQDIQHSDTNRSQNINEIDIKSQNSNDSLISKPPQNIEADINPTGNEQKAIESKAEPSNLLNSESKEANCDNVSDLKKDDVSMNHDIVNSNLQNGEQPIEHINEVNSDEYDSDKTSLKEENDLKDK
ncbi:uncharacterized protein TNIN_424571 [Trichonephila inaurata madagascariensis]|uniref:Uncharacterized protein n=1 Tax=Trichonephila inaurata madagascariensis TaxID=2747483 RepID=A0A8X6XN92_9ARAC|nr:uncharacterized protein TNIN_424571 [Trichonephila inaurata madagascariensis]